MALTPFIKWYTDDSVIVRGHGLGEDALYLCGDKPARYPVPVKQDTYYPQPYQYWIVEWCFENAYHLCVDHA